MAFPQYAPLHLGQALALRMPHSLGVCPHNNSYQNYSHLDPKVVVLSPHNIFWCFVHVHFKVMA